jgi:hypothetical protein
VVTAAGRRLSNEEFNNLYRSSNITSVVESWTMKWEGKMTNTDELEMYSYTALFSTILKAKYNPECVCVD